MTWQQSIGGWQWQQSGVSSSSGNSTQPKSWKPGDQAPGASERARSRHCGVKKSYAAALSTTKVQSWSGWTQPKPNSSSQVSQQLQQVAAQLQSVCGNDPAQASQSLDVPIVESSGSGEVIRQIKQVEKSSQQSGRGRSGAGICEENVRTTTHRVEDTAESTTTFEQKIGKREACSAESSKESGGSESCVHSGPDCQRAGGLRSSENSSRTLHTRTRSSRSSYRSHRRTPTRPLLVHHRQYHFCTTQSWSACRAPGAGTTSSPHTHQWSARVMHSCGSGDGCRRARRPDDGLRWLGRGIPADAIESIARRRNRQVGKKTIGLQTLANRERNLNSHKPWRSPARSTHNAVRVTHTERLVLATVNVKSLKAKELSPSHKYGVDTNSTTSTRLTET